MSLSKKHTQKKDFKKCKGLPKKKSQNKLKKSNKRLRKKTGGMLARFMSGIRPKSPQKEELHQKEELPQEEEIPQKKVLQDPNLELQTNPPAIIKLVICFKEMDDYFQFQDKALLIPMKKISIKDLFKCPGLEPHHKQQITDKFGSNVVYYLLRNPVNDMFHLYIVGIFEERNAIEQFRYLYKNNLYDTKMSQNLFELPIEDDIGDYCNIPFLEFESRHLSIKKEYKDAQFHYLPSEIIDKE